MTPKPATLANCNRFETLYGIYIAKLARVEELKANGRYGYQLRMPFKAVDIAADALVAEFPEAANIL